MGSIHFFTDGVEKIPIDELALEEFLSWMIQKEGKKLNELNYIFCSDEKLLKINKEFLKRDYYTDVISFNLSEDDGISGEVYISEERVRENAKEAGQSLDNERYRVVFHGLLHLIGYNDQEKEDKERMTEKENQYLEAYVSRGTNEQ